MIPNHAHAICRNIRDAKYLRGNESILVSAADSMYKPNANIMIIGEKTINPIIYFAEGVIFVMFNDQAEGKRRRKD
jgi:hypothetical protein